jgi:hypothetical protein
MDADVELSVVVMVTATIFLLASRYGRGRLARMTRWKGPGTVRQDRSSAFEGRTRSSRTAQLTSLPLSSIPRVVPLHRSSHGADLGDEP